MTWEQEQEAKYKERQEQKRERNLQRVQTARNWAAALEIFQGFLKSYREDCVRQLAMHDYSSDFELQDILAGLRVLEEFSKRGEMYISEGAVAERELMEDLDNQS